MYLASRSGIEPCIGRGSVNPWTTREAPLLADSPSQPSEGSQHLDLRLPVCETICFCCVSPTSLWPLAAAVLETHSKAPQQLELPPAGQGVCSGIPQEMPPQVQPWWCLSVSQDQLPSVKAVVLPAPPRPEHPHSPQPEYLTRLSRWFWRSRQDREWTVFVSPVFKEHLEMPSTVLGSKAAD